jgi:hypothetical protein
MSRNNRRAKAESQIRAAAADFVARSKLKSNRP